MTNSKDCIMYDQLLLDCCSSGNVKQLQDLIHSTTFSDNIKVDGCINAAKNSHVDIIKLMLSSGLNIESLICSVIQLNDSQLLDVLQQSGIAFTDECSNGDTYLMYAALNHKHECMEHLIRLGVHCNQQSSTGDTVLSRLCSLEYNYSVEIRILASQGVNLDEPFEEYWTAMHMSALCGNYPNTEQLLELGAYVNALDIHDETPLMKAIRYGDKCLVKLLLENGAIVDIQNDKYQAALHVALQMYQHDVNVCEIVDLLLHYDIDAEYVDHKNRTPLLYSIQTTCANCFDSVLHRTELATVEYTFRLQHFVYACLIENVYMCEKLIAHKCCVGIERSWIVKYGDQCANVLNVQDSFNVDEQRHCEKMNQMFFGAGECIPIHMLSNPHRIAREAMETHPQSLMSCARKVVREQMLKASNVNIIVRVNSLPLTECMKRYVIFQH